MGASVGDGDGSGGWLTAGQGKGESEPDPARSEGEPEEGVFIRGNLGRPYRFDHRSEAGEDGGPQKGVASWRDDEPESE